MEDNVRQFVLVIACLGGKFGINCSNAFFENIEIARVKREQFKNFTESRGKKSKNRSNYTCDYWLITPN